MKIQCPYCKEEIKTNKIIAYCENCNAVCVDITKIILIIVVSVSILYILTMVLTR